MVDTWAATGAGAFSLSENGLYTVEGWKTFLSALTPNGLFTVSRWHSPRSTVELGRVVSLAVATLMELGVERPERPHLHRRGRQSRHRHRVARAVRPVRPAGTAGHRRQVALHRAREPGPARYGHGHRRHAHGAEPAGPERTGRAPLPRRVPAHRRPAILLQPASVHPSERHPLRVTANGGMARLSIRDQAGAATSSPSARFFWSFSCRPSSSYTSSSCRRDPPFARSTGNWRWSAAATFC